MAIAEISFEANGYFVHKIAFPVRVPEVLVCMSSLDNFPQLYTLWYVLKISVSHFQNKRYCIFLFGKCTESATK